MDKANSVEDSGHNPGGLEQDIRAKTFPGNVIKNTSNGHAPSNTGNCAD